MGSSLTTGNIDDDCDMFVSDKSARVMSMTRSGAVEASPGSEAEERHVTRN